MGVTEAEWEHDHQTFEAAYWGDCANTYHEETKQLAYARLMGLVAGPWQGGTAWPSYDMRGQSVLDVGGGPVSMLLKCVNLGEALVVDPCPYPEWTLDRYSDHGVDVLKMTAEDFFADTPSLPNETWDEAWLYNVLQHTLDPEAIVVGMVERAATVRIFEWIETDVYEGHPHSMSATALDEWVGQRGKVITLDEWYRPIEDRKPMPDPSRVEQKAWGGVFGRG